MKNPTAPRTEVPTLARRRSSHLRGLAPLAKAGQAGPLDEVIAAMAGRAAYGADAYLPVETPGEGRTVDVCSSCPVDCCSHHIIPLSVQDAYDIRVGLNLPWASFAALLPYASGSPTWPVRLGRGRAMLALRRRRHSCIFLHRIDGHRRCAIHGLRPLACRLYPFLPEASAQARAPDGMLAQRSPSECPWRWPRTDQQVAQVDAWIARNAQRRELDEQVLRTWHRQMNLPHDRDHFYQYLQQEMTRRAQGGQGTGPWRTSLW